MGTNVISPLGWFPFATVRWCWCVRHDRHWCTLLTNTQSIFLTWQQTVFADENGGIEWMHKRLSCELKFFDIFIELCWAKIRPYKTIFSSSVVLSGLNSGTLDYTTLVDTINEQTYHFPNITTNSVRWRKWRKWMDA